MPSTGRLRMSGARSLTSAVILVLLHVALVAAFGATYEVPLSRTPELAFRVEAPEGWAFSAEGFAAYDLRYSYAVLHNRPPEEIRVFAHAESTVVEARYDTTGAGLDSLRLLSLGGIQVITRYDERAFEEQLAPGTVCVDIGMRTGGPPPPRVYGWTEAMSPESRLQEFVANRTPAWDTERSIGYRVRFFRWGEAWDVHVVARKPFLERDLEDAFRIAGSLRFPRTPVMSEEQAIETATVSLPVHMRVRDEWLEQCGKLGLHYDVDVDREGEAFRVTFRRLDGTEAKTVLESRTYRVDRDGTVTELAGHER
jgi:hypothetical protein